MLACYALGLRRSEVCGIRLDDVDWAGRRVFIREAKGDRPRWVEMNEIAEEALLALRWGESHPPIDPLTSATPSPSSRSSASGASASIPIGRLAAQSPRGLVLESTRTAPKPGVAPNSVANVRGTAVAQVLPPAGAVQLPLVGYHPQWFSMIVHQAAVDAGFPPGRRNAHLLRSSFATHLLGKGVPISVVSKLLGHSQIATTSRYLAVRGEDRRAAVDALVLESA